ncbi:hypothetical protein OSH08_09495 [Kaistia geumhonensis]|uniref:Membrane protein YkoI n=1 Tax=Kaistia geumhonensis TaxID=410839 RepID=A0ABU0M3L4_9HYPH|nr:hypothetical protein [Kaistia geumhonensis]MCX5479238.1 hypothetical protein [Kaistia geumhonensis]MDQ0515541.1 putative membrane protein YkoI [Kaistia geumhonensis]
MISPRLLLLIAVIGLLQPGTAFAQGCLSQAEARQAVQNGEAISLSQVRGSLPGDVVSAQLCRGGGGLVYVVNVLGEGGKVQRLTIDARSGAVAGN